MFIHFSQIDPFHLLNHPQSKSMCECFPDSLSPTHTQYVQKKSNSNSLSAVSTQHSNIQKKNDLRYS